MNKFFFGAILGISLLSAAYGQKAEVTVVLNEPFFDTILDSVFQHLDPLEFPISSQASECRESVKILRVMNGVKTALRFRQGKINVPLAFSAVYDPPLLGCTQIAGTGEATLDLEFDAENQRVIGRVRVGSVNPNGTGGIGGSLIARFVQGTIDKRINPIEIVRLDKLSLIVPVHNVGNLRMRATGARTEIVNGALNVYISYEFSKG